MHDAMGQFEAAVSLRPGDPGYRYNLAIAYEALGLLEKAREQILRAKSLPKK